MKVLIDIDDKLYKDIQTIGIPIGKIDYVLKAIKNGIPLEQIRQEIVQLLDKYEIKNFADADDYYMAILHVKEIIDKYTKGDKDEVN